VFSRKEAACSCLLLLEWIPYPDCRFDQRILGIFIDLEHHIFEPDPGLMGSTKTKVDRARPGGDRQSKPSAACGPSLGFKSCHCGRERLICYALFLLWRAHWALGIVKARGTFCSGLSASEVTPITKTDHDLALHWRRKAA
jgi:hypothetical protein